MVQVSDRCDTGLAATLAVRDSTKQLQTNTHTAHSTAIQLEFVLVTIQLFISLNSRL